MPDQDIPVIKILPEHPGTIVGVRRLGEKKPRVIGIYDLATGKQSQWKLPSELFALAEMHGIIYSPAAFIDWASDAQEFLLNSGSEIDLLKKNGTYSVLHLNMPGKLNPYEGMHDYAISPDGKFVAYSLYTRDRDDTLYMDVFYQRTEGSTPIKIITGSPDSHPAWSPDGKKIAFSRIFDYHGISILNGIGIVDLQGHEVASVPPVDAKVWPKQGITQIRWSPDGNKIAFIFDSKLYLANADGSKSAFMDFKQNNITVANVAWSPTSQQLAFHSSFEAGEKCSYNIFYKAEVGQFPCIGKYYLYTANADGTNLKRITKEPEYFPSSIFWIY